MIAESTLACRHCGHRATETMPEDAGLVFYACQGCERVLRPVPGDCCVFCTYGNVPAQAARANAS